MRSPRSLLLCLIIIGFGASIEALLNGCEKGWVPFGKSCYKFSTSTATFKDALVICNKYGARLLELKSKWEESWLDLHSRVRGYARVWLGVSDLQKEGHFVTLSDARQPSYNNWLKGEPNNHNNEDCVEYWMSKGGWNDWICTNKGNYVCEK